MSLNKYFRRIARRPTDPGKGSYWAIDVTLGPGRKRPYRRNRKPGKRELQRLAEEAAAAAELDDGSTPSSSVDTGATDISVVAGGIEDNTGSDHQTEPESPFVASDNPDIGDDGYDSEESVSQQLIPRDLTPINTNLGSPATSPCVVPATVPATNETLRALSSFSHRAALHPPPSSNLSASLAKTCSLPIGVAPQTVILQPKPITPVRMFDIPILHTPAPRREERPVPILQVETTSQPVGEPSRIRRPPSPPYLPPLPLRKIKAIQKRKSYVQYDSDSDLEPRPPSSPTSSSPSRTKRPHPTASPSTSHEYAFSAPFGVEIIPGPRPIKITHHPLPANFGRGPFSFDPDANYSSQEASSSSSVRRTSPVYFATPGPSIFASSAHKRLRRSPVSHLPPASTLHTHRTHTHTADDPPRTYTASIFNRDTRLVRANTLPNADRTPPQYTLPNPSSHCGIPPPSQSLQAVTHTHTHLDHHIHSHPSKPPITASRRPTVYRSHTYHAPQQHTAGLITQPNTGKHIVGRTGAVSNSTSIHVPVQRPADGQRAVYTDSRGTVYPNSGRNVDFSSDSE